MSSKSGTTLEPNVLADYFYSRVQAVVEHDAGAHFVLITDPGSPLQAVAAQRGYWHEFFGEPGIGGRYSALSRFGMVPAAAKSAGCHSEHQAASSWSASAPS